MRSDLQQLCSDDYDNDDCNGGGGEKKHTKTSSHLCSINHAPNVVCLPKLISFRTQQKLDMIKLYQENP